MEKSDEEWDIEKFLELKSENESGPGSKIECPTLKNLPLWAKFYDQIVVGVKGQELSPLQHRLFDPESVFEFWHFLTHSKSEGIERTQEFFRMMIEGEIPPNPGDLFTVPLSPAPDPSILEILRKEFPHFDRAGVLEALMENLVLARVGDGAVSFDPILLVGDPGIGKTRFFRRLASILKIHSTFEVDCASSSAGWILTGLSSSWYGSKPGEILSLLTVYKGGTGNPMIFLDELDKAHDGKDSPMNALYGLLEPESARRFRDEFCPIQTDASRILWIAGANTIDCTPSPIRSRFRIFHIPLPTHDEKRIIAQAIWTESLATSGLWSLFEEDLSTQVLDHLLYISPREIRIRLRSAAARALVRTGNTGKEKKRCAISLEDVRGPCERFPGQRPTIGFR